MRTQALSGISGTWSGSAWATDDRKSGETTEILDPERSETKCFSLSWATSIGSDVALMKLSFLIIFSMSLLRSEKETKVPLEKNINTWSARGKIDSTRLWESRVFSLWRRSLFSFDKYQTTSFLWRVQFSRISWKTLCLIVAFFGWYVLSAIFASDWILMWEIKMIFVISLFLRYEFNSTCSTCWPEELKLDSSSDQQWNETANIDIFLKLLYLIRI